MRPDGWLQVAGPERSLVGRHGRIAVQGLLQGGPISLRWSFDDNEAGRVPCQGIQGVGDAIRHVATGAAKGLGELIEFVRPKRFARERVKRREAVKK